MQFFEENGYVLIAKALSDAELTYLNAFCDATRETDPEIWGIGHLLHQEEVTLPCPLFFQLDTETPPALPNESLLCLGHSSHSL